MNFGLSLNLDLKKKTTLFSQEVRKVIENWHYHPTPLNHSTIFGIMANQTSLPFTTIVCFTNVIDLF